MMTVPAGLSPTDSDLSETIAAFMKAQKHRVVVDKHLGGGAHLLRTDDDNVLINTYISLDPSADQSIDLEQSLVKEIVEPNRTEIIIPNRLGPLAADIKRPIHDLVARVSTANDFFDAFLRPRSLCQSLINPPADSKLATNLLDEQYFVAPSARIQNAPQPVTALNYLFEHWAKNKSARFSVLLGPAGYGKSKIVHILAKRLAKYYEAGDPFDKPAVPFLISFAEYRRTTSFSGLILQALDSFGAALLTTDAFQFLVRLGRVLFILDGFDEMMEASPDTARGNIRDFIEHAGTTSRILLTSRTTFFRTSEDVETEFESHVLTHDEIEVLEVQPFDRPRAKEYLARRLPLGSSQTLRRAQEVIDDNEYFAALQSPLFLTEFADSIYEQNWSKTDLRSEGFYEFLIKRAFERERIRQEHDYTDEEQQRYLELFAYELLSNQENGYPADLLEVFVVEAIDDEERARYWRKLISHHFLTDLPGTTLLSMRHQLWREHFQGSALAHALRNEPGDMPLQRRAAIELLSKRSLPEGVLKATGQQLGVDRLLAICITDSDRQLSDSMLKNLLRAALLNNWELEAFFESLGAGTQLFKGRDLTEVTFRNTNFGQADFSNANLSGAFFYHCDLSECTFEGTVLAGTSFQASLIPEALLEGSVRSISVDGEAYYGPHEVARAIGASSVAKERIGEESVWKEELLKSRVLRFVRWAGDEPIFDNYIGWRSFLGGTDPRDTGFARTRLFRAMRKEGLVDDRPTMAGREAIMVSPDAETRKELLAFAIHGKKGPRIKAVLQRLER